MQTLKEYNERLDEVNRQINKPIEGVEEEKGEPEIEVIKVKG